MSENTGSGVDVVAEQALRLAVGLDELHLRLVAAAEAQVVQRLGVDREVADRSAVLRRHVGDRRAVGQRQVGEAGAEELDELADDALALRSICVTVSTRSVAVAPSRSWPVSRKPTTSGISIGLGWPEQRRLGLDAADAPAEHAEAVDHRRVGVGADHGVGVGHQHAVDVRPGRRRAPGTRG